MRRFLFTLVGLALLLAFGSMLIAEGPATLPPFTISAKTMTLNLKRTPRSLVYAGDVKYQSPLYQTLITCQRLETNASALNAVSTVTATGNVVFTMTAEPAEKGQPTYRINGATQLLVYTIQGGEPVIRLVKEKGVQPSLIITDLTSKEKTDLTGTGDIIEYNLQTQTLEVKNVEMKSEGGGN